MITPLTTPTFTELVDALIVHGEAMMTASSSSQMQLEDVARHGYLMKIREIEGTAGFPSEEDAAALVRLRSWEALHGVPSDERA